MQDFLSQRQNQLEPGCIGFVQVFQVQHNRTEFRQDRTQNLELLSFGKGFTMLEAFQ